MKKLLLLLPFLFLITGMAINHPSNAKTADENIISLVKAIDTNEINMAEYAYNSSHNAQIKQHADFMVKQHEANLRALIKLAKKQHWDFATNTEEIALQLHGKKEMVKLRLASSREFDKKYVKDMVNDHQNALELIDRSIKETNNPALLRFLKATRSDIAHHLAMSKELEKQGLRMSNSNVMP